jgi:hypothetical protein
VLCFARGYATDRVCHELLAQIIHKASATVTFFGAAHCRDVAFSSAKVAISRNERRQLLIRRSSTPGESDAVFIYVPAGDLLHPSASHRDAMSVAIQPLPRPPFRKNHFPTHIFLSTKSSSSDCRIPTPLSPFFKYFELFSRHNSLPHNDLQHKIPIPPRFFLNLGHHFCYNARN